MRMIDANVLISEIHRYDEQQKNDVWLTSDIEYLLAQQPTVDAVPVVRGRWIKDGEMVVCSECGEEHAWDEYRATYCEDCGAKMDGENEDG